MNTVHRLFFADSRQMQPLSDQSIDLVVTSPPYPMIEMWDGVFSRMDPKIGRELAAGAGWRAYEQMHAILDGVWKEVCRVLRPGGFACINIGDAVRKIGDDFLLYPNHARIIQAMTANGLSPLPAVIWRKQTNAPNKFMGSGMLPAGAYVTLEHEYILVFRKGPKRAFRGEAEKLNRHQSALFWEERNQWFSDVWFDIKGARQQMAGESIRKRSGAYPFELPYRLILMYSVMGDTVLDPFAGIGTTLFAAMAAARNSVGMEIEADFYAAVAEKLDGIVDFANRVIEERIDRHLEFAAGRPLEHFNDHYGFPVMTRQEKQLRMYRLKRVETAGRGVFSVKYESARAPVFSSTREPGGAKRPEKDAAGKNRPVQQSLFKDAKK